MLFKVMGICVCVKRKRGGSDELVKLLQLTLHTVVHYDMSVDKVSRYCHCNWCIITWGHSRYC